MAHIACMIVVEFIGQAEVRADEATPDLGHEFLETISLVTEPLAECPGEPRRASGPMNGFMGSGRGIVVHRLERALMRHLDIIERGVKIGAVAAVPHLGRNRLEEGVDRGLARRRIDRRRIFVSRIEIGRQA